MKETQRSAESNCDDKPGIVRYRRPVFHLAKALLCLFVIVRFVLPLPWPRWLQILLSLVLMVVFQHSLISLLVFGTMFSPEVPRATMIIANLVSGTVLLLAMAQFAVDSVSVALALVKWRRVSIPPGLRYAIGIASLLLSGFAVSQAIRIPPVKQVEILPLEFEGYRLVQLTDLHISRLFPAPWVEAIVEITNEQRPDLIVITGDLIDGDLHARHSDVQPLAKLQASDGVLTIPGNHEYYFGHDAWMKRYQALGLRPLSNSHTVLGRGSGKLVVAGVND